MRKISKTLYRFLIIITHAFLLCRSNIFLSKDILSLKRVSSYNSLNSTHIAENHLIGTSLPTVYNISTYSL